MWARVARESGAKTEWRRIGDVLRRMAMTAHAVKHWLLKIFTPEDGGSGHCHCDNRVVGANYIADWLMDNL